MKRVSLVIVVGALLTLLSLVLLLWNPVFVQGISNLIQDGLMRQVAQPAKTGRVAIVDIDEVSLHEYGQWPWPRFVLADLLGRLWAAGASVVAFDVIFPEVDRTSPRVWKKSIRDHFNSDVSIDSIEARNQDFDRLFGEQLAMGRSILGCMLTIPADGILMDGGVPWLDPHFKGHGVIDRPEGIRYLLPSAGMQASNPQLRGSAETAFINADPDKDNIVRRSPLVIAAPGERLYPSLALEAIRLSQGPPFPSFRVFVDEKAKGISRIEVGRHKCATDREGHVVVNFRKLKPKTVRDGDSSFPVHSALDVLAGRVSPDQLKGRIVFVGTSAAGLRDLKATPLASAFPGVEVHATIVDNVLAGDVLRIPDETDGLQAVLVLLAGLFLTVGIDKSRSWLSFLLAASLMGVTTAMSCLLLSAYGIVFKSSWAILTVGIMYPVLTTMKYWQEELQKRRVRLMFGTMVSDTVLRYLEKNPGSFSLSGYRTDATMFFSDIAGFSNMTESLRPDQLSELLKSYLSPMTRIIMDRGGYVDKYEGDLIMAEWGVPFPMEDHAIQACLAALEQQEALVTLRPELKRRFGQDVEVRMGINTGTVTAGNMGSDRHFQFTVLGDAVNLTARLEPANKDYKSRIIIGGSTQQLVCNELETRLLDRIVVKGITRPVEIYELLARKNGLTEAKREIVHLYEESLRLHWQRHWDDALRLLERALQMDENDGPCFNLRTRIEWYKSHPPVAEWSGEHVRAAKD